MQVFLKEKGKLSLKDVTKESMYFIEAHGYKHEKKTNGSNGKASTNKPNGNNESTGQPQAAAAAPASCGNCGMKNTPLVNAVS